jgi:hypothetical protein
LNRKTREPSTTLMGASLTPRGSSVNPFSMTLAERIVVVARQWQDHAYGRLGNRRSSSLEPLQRRARLRGARLRPTAESGSAPQTCSGVLGALPRSSPPREAASRCSRAPSGGDPRSARPDRGRGGATQGRRGALVAGIADEGPTAKEVSPGGPPSTTTTKRPSKRKPPPPPLNPTGYCTNKGDDCYAPMPPDPTKMRCTECDGWTGNPSATPGGPPMSDEETKEMRRRVGAARANAEEVKAERRRKRHR